MTHVKLMGELGEKFGTDWVSADNNMRDIFKLIEAQCEGFADEMMYMLEKDNIGLEIIKVILMVIYKMMQVFLVLFQII